MIFIFSSDRAQRLLATAGDNPTSGVAVDKAKKRVGSLGKFVQGSFFDDAEEVSTYTIEYIVRVCVCTCARACAYVHACMCVCGSVIMIIIFIH